MSDWNKISENIETINVLDPDDPLMERFQNALNLHLTKINNKLSNEIDELSLSLKSVGKLREDKESEMYDVQREVTRQQSTIEKYRTLIESMKENRGEKEDDLNELKKKRNEMLEITEIERNKYELLMRDKENVSIINKQLNTFKQEISNHLIVAKKMSLKDAKVEREMLRQKQEADYILLKLSEVVWNMEKETDQVNKQIELKSNEVTIINEAIADADADIKAVQRERKYLIDAWNKVVSSIYQRDEIYQQLSEQRTKIRESLKMLQTQIENVKKNTTNSMEDNEKLTSIKYRIEQNINHQEKIIEIEEEKFQGLEYKTDKLLILLEQSNVNFKDISNEYGNLNVEMKSIKKEYDKLSEEKNVLEEEILNKLKNNMSNNNKIKNLNKLLRDKREMVKQLELNMLQIENDYGKNLLNLEKLTNDITNERNDLDELMKLNNIRENELTNLQVQIEKYNDLIKRKQTKIVDLNVKINEINNNTNKDLEDIKITQLEKNIDDIERKNIENQQYWLRQENILLNLTQQRDNQIEEINLLNKYLNIMEHKNIKINNSLEIEMKNKETIDKTINELHKRMLKINSTLTEQKQLKSFFENKYRLSEDEYLITLKNTEKEIIQLKNSIKELNNEKKTLEYKLDETQRQYLSWNKKLKLLIEACQMIKQEENPGGDIAIMKNEIHRMEMRLSYLKKAQEKMIKDMESCIIKRDHIVDAAMAKEKRPSKIQQNKQIIFEKRIETRKAKVKQIFKENKMIESRINEMKKEIATVEVNMKDNTAMIKQLETELNELNKKIEDLELMKHHKLECLVRKQRKIKFLQDVKDKKYKMFFKTEVSLNNEFEKQKVLNTDLIEIMEQSQQDFPLLKDDIKKILLTINNQV